MRGLLHDLRGAGVVDFEVVIEVVVLLLLFVVFLVLIVEIIVFPEFFVFLEFFVYFDFVADDSAGLVARFFDTGAGVSLVKVALHRWASSLTI